MPIAAGNLFIGSFDVNNAMSNPLQATKFGLPFRHVPTYLAGYYKYKAGDQFTEGGKPVEGKRDVYKRQVHYRCIQTIYNGRWRKRIFRRSKS